MNTFLANGSPILGNPDAPVTLVEFGDYQCHFCNVFFHSTEDDILKNYVETGKVRMIPLRKLGEDAEKVSIGDTIEVDNKNGVVRFIGSGRVQIDYNHRFAGKTLLYDINVLKELKTDDEKTSGILKRYLPVKEDKILFKKTGNILDITIPEEMFRADGLHAIKHFVQTDVFKFISALEKVNFVETYVKQQTKSQEKTSSKKTETKTKKAKAP